MFGCVLVQIRIRDPDFLSVELVEGTSVITGPKYNKGPSVIAFEPKRNKERKTSNNMCRPAAK